MATHGGPAAADWLKREEGEPGSLRPHTHADWGDGGALKAEGPDVKADTKGDAKGDLQHRYPFLTLCKMFETIQAKKGHAERLKQLDQLWQALRGHDYFPFMRLIVPQLDTARSTYGLKESKLALYYTEILVISPQSPDAMRLRRWKDPGLNPGQGTHFSDAAFAVLQKRGWQAVGTSLTIAAINDLLNALCAARTPDEKKKVFLGLIRNTSALEQKWALRIILKDMRMQLQHTSILAAFHPNAMDLYNVSTDLRAVCVQCTDPSFQPHTIGIRLFQPLAPMLAQILPPAQVDTLLGTTRYVVEPKYDGERLMVHFERSADKLMFWTRNKKDYTDLYHRFVPVVKQHLRCASCILDGECLVWNTRTQRFKEFGHNRTYAISAAAESEEQFCFIAFDCLFLDGHDLTANPWHQRRACLERAVKPRDKVLEVVAVQRVEDLKAVLAALDCAIAKGEEGIILKARESPYVPGERKLKWMKLKADHVSGMGDTLDLLVLGGYYGTKFGQRHISHFLLGVRAAEPPDAPAWHTVCKVGTGYNNAELQALHRHFEGRWRPFDRTRMPPHFCGWEVAADDVPDMWVPPEDSLVMEVKGYSFVPTTKFKVGHTVRFPRMLRIRYDKSPEQATSLAELRTLLEQSQARPRAIAFTDNFQLNAQVRKLHRQTAAGAAPSRKVAVLSAYADGRAVAPAEVRSRLFDGMEFCVLAVDRGITKADLELLIVAHGGTKVQNPTERTAVLLAGDRPSVRVDNWRRKCESGFNEFGMKDVIHYRWLLRCIAEYDRRREAGSGEDNLALVDLHPRYMVYTRPDQQAAFDQCLDAYEDSYTADTSFELLRHVFCNIDGGGPSQNATHRSQSKPTPSPTVRAKPSTPSSHASDGRAAPPGEGPSTGGTAAQPTDTPWGQLQETCRRIADLKRQVAEHCGTVFEAEGDGDAFSFFSGLVFWLPSPPPLGEDVVTTSAPPAPPPVLERSDTVPLELDRPPPPGCLTTLRLWATLYGAEVVDNPQDRRITHVLIDVGSVGANFSLAGALTGAAVVPARWLEACCAARRRLPEAAFPLDLPALLEPGRSFRERWAALVGDGPTETPESPVAIA
eukprot:EG_transcript_1394